MTLHSSLWCEVQIHGCYHSFSLPGAPAILHVSALSFLSLLGAHISWFDFSPFHPVSSQLCLPGIPPIGTLLQGSDDPNFEVSKIWLLDKMLFRQMSALNNFGDHILLWVLHLDCIHHCYLDSPTVLCGELDEGLNGCFQSLLLTGSWHPHYPSCTGCEPLCYFLYFWHFSPMLLISHQVCGSALCLVFLINRFLPISTAVTPSSYRQQLISAFSPTTLPFCRACQNPNLASLSPGTSFLHWSLSQSPNVCFIKRWCWGIVMSNVFKTRLCD